MTDYRTNTTLEAIAERIGGVKRVLLTTHTKPDGDALGSCLALQRALTARSTQADIYIAGPVDNALTIIAGDTPLHPIDQQLPNDAYDLAIVSDTGAWTQLEAIRPWLEPRRAMTIGLDHHARGDDVAALRWVDTSAASATMIVADVLDAIHIPLAGGEQSVAEALFLGVATDTGWFRHSNADGRAFAFAARLLDAGIDKARLYELTEESYAPSRIALLARALNSMELLADGSVALMMLTPEDFAAAGASATDTTGIINSPMAAAQVRVSILLTRFNDGPTKISFRSKPAALGRPADEFVDVNVLAQQFGGGGHVHAAGARSDQTLEQVRQDIIAALAAAVT